ncbi:4479_t:CDS:2 [Funneliformis caledonium]|uniref:4479_t:CDS:1 n=1 Tax=Funneliformis caledonium TaxID=1117310 RepID=A0A9N9DJW3_9GLOM|nr:4479_t:CDS:2 [Funneliformis caledonium]
MGYNPIYVILLILIKKHLLLYIIDNGNFAIFALDNEKESQDKSSTTDENTIFILVDLENAIPVNEDANATSPIKAIHTTLGNSENLNDSISKVTSNQI